MATLTVYSNSAGGDISSSGSPYTTARSGGSLTAGTASATFLTGQQWSAGTTFICREGFLAFDTSVLPDDAIVTSVVLSVKPNSTTAHDNPFTLNARLYNWGATLTTADWVAGASLAANTLLASVDTTGASAGTFLDLSPESAFASNISLTGTTYILLSSSRHEAGTSPGTTGSADDALQFHSGNAASDADKPKLVITYDLPLPPEGTFQGVATMTAVMTQDTTPANPDYTKYDAYINRLGVQLYQGEGSRNQTGTIPLDLERTDTGNNPNEQPSALGRQFAQSDFSHGSGQGYFDKQSSDQAKFLYSEGFDTSEIGVLKHLNAVLVADGGALTAGSSGRSCICQGKLFVADGTNVLVYDPITGSVTVEDPDAGEVGSPVVRDLVTEGDQVYAALGANGIHVRSAAGTWTHYSAAEAILVKHLKDRLIACTARILYEITASGAAPTGKLTLKEGWTFTDLGENGPYIYATAIDEDSGLSKVHHFGLDNTLAVTVQGSTWLPNGDLCYSFKGYLGTVYIGCGRLNSSGGKDALLYRAEPDDDGYLNFQLIQESEGAGSRDLAVKAIATKGRNILCGWTLGEDSPYGVREGLAHYDPALASFTHHLASSTSTETPDPVLSCGIYEGRIYFVTIDGVHYEDLDNKVAEATFISSISNFNHAGLKTWDQSDLITKPLPAGSSVEMDYTTVHPEDGTWSNAGIHTGTGETKDTFDHPNVESATFAVRLVSAATSDQSDAPQIEGFSVRQNPVDEATYRIERTLQFLGKKAKSQRGEVYYENPRASRDAIRGLYLSWVSFHEADTSYYGRVIGIQELKAVNSYQVTRGDAQQEEYVLLIQIDGQAS